MANEHAPLPEERRLRFERALLAEEGLSLEGARVLGDGYATQAWLLADGHTVARIPRSDWGARSLERETSLLPLLEDMRLPVRTPEGARAVRDAEGFTGALHRLVDGVDLAERLGRLDARTSAAVGLTSVASCPRCTRSPSTRGRRPHPTRGRWTSRAGSRCCSPTSRCASAGGSRRALRVSSSSCRPKAHRRSSPGDLWRHHIFLDGDDRLSGVIDFGLAGVEDPAWDLRFLAPRSNIVQGLGPSFVAALLEGYDRPLDGAALERAEVYGDLDQAGDACFELTIVAEPTHFLDDLRTLIAQSGD